jgi:hypothetical protein
MCREARLTKRWTEDFGRPGGNRSGGAKGYGALGRGQDVGIREADKTQRETVHPKRMYAQLKAKCLTTAARNLQARTWVY